MRMTPLTVIALTRHCVRAAEAGTNAWRSRMPSTSGRQERLPSGVRGGSSRGRDAEEYAEVRRSHPAIERKLSELVRRHDVATPAIEVNGACCISAC